MLAVNLKHAASVEKKELLYKILVVGDIGTGKTSIIKRYIHQFFSEHYRATIGVDFALKIINWDADTTVRLQLWDIAGQERFGNMTRIYYKEAVGAFIVFDMARATTYNAAAKWKADLDQKVQLPNGEPVPCVLLANKCDQPKEDLMNNTSQIDDFCKEQGFIGWFETSAKENININEAARFLLTQIIQNDNAMKAAEESKDRDKITLDETDSSKKTQRNQCCS